MVAKPDDVKQAATQAVTAGVMRVVATVVDPQTAAKKLVDDARDFPGKVIERAAELPVKALSQLAELQAQVAELPKVAAGLPLKLALQAVAAGEKVRNLLPGQGSATPDAADEAADAATTAPAKASSGAAAWDAAAPRPAPEAYTPPVAGGHTAQAAKVTRAELKAVPDMPETPAGVPASKTVPAKKAVAKRAPTKKAPAKASPASAKAAAKPATVSKATATAAKVGAKTIAKAAPAEQVSATTHDVLATLADAGSTPTPDTTPNTPSAAAPAPDAAPAAAAPAPAPDTARAAAKPASAGSPAATPEAPTAGPAPAAEPAPTSETLATVTPIHAGRDGHVEANLPSAVEAAIEAAPDGSTLTTDELPLAGYGSLSITQIRSRISKLDAVQLAQLRDYERAHADRAPIVTLLETKLAKVTTASADGKGSAVGKESTVSSSAPNETAALIAEAPKE